MSKRQKRLLWLLGIVAIGSFVTSVARIGGWRAASAPPPAPPPVKQRVYVRAGAVWPQLRRNLDVLGDRLKKPGKEQLFLAGVLTRSGEDHVAPINLTLEPGQRLSLSIAGGPPQLVSVHSTRAPSSSLSERDRDLVEALLFDSAESFFLGQAAGAQTRFLGSQFQLDEPEYSNRRFDLYAVTSTNEADSQRVDGSKTYYFDSDSGLLEMVRYQIQRAGIPVSIQITLRNWETESGETVARRIDRRENGAPVWSLTVNSAMVGRSND